MFRITSLMKENECVEYAKLLIKTERTKEENRRLETLKHLSTMNGAVVGIDNLLNITFGDKHVVNVLDYPNVSGLYRVQVLIKGKMKTVARVKIGKKDAYILVRESTAKKLNKAYEIINYNLPAGYYVPLNQTYKELRKVIEYHYTEQTA